MQAYLLGLRPSSSSSDGGAGLFLASRKPTTLLGPWACCDGRSRSGTLGPAPAVNGEQDHYAVLGLSKSASAADVKRAYRLLARKYHPDVSRESQAGKVFKTIRFAYEVLSNEATRAQYDRALKFQETTGRPHWKNWEYDPESEYGKRIYKWAELRQQMRYKKQERTSYGQAYAYEETSDYERAPFSEVLWFAFFSLFLMQTLGCRTSLIFCGLMALADKHLDAGYKMGYVIAWLLGGRGGILLTLCISFASWLCGKNSSNLIALVVLAMWIGANLARFAPLPQGAVLALLYMSIKLQDDLR